MGKIKILIACHKPYEVINDEIYTPIHVGRAISKYKEEMSEMIGDDTGDNISEKNPYYSEMTAQYWAWKNVKDIEYIGFCHYRRFFETHFTEQNIENFLKNDNDVIMAGPVFRHYGRFNFLKTFVCPEDLGIMLYAVKTKYPEYYKTLSEYAYGLIDYPLNMFVCRKELFDKYAEWIFNILFECEKLIKLQPYSRGRRVFGYLSEFLMPVFFLHNGCNIKAMRYKTEFNHLEGGIDMKTKIKMALINMALGKQSNKTLEANYAIKAALKADNIIKEDF